VIFANIRDEIILIRVLVLVMAEKKASGFLQVVSLDNQTSQVALIHTFLTTKSPPRLSREPRSPESEHCITPPPPGIPPLMGSIPITLAGLAPKKLGLPSGPCQPLSVFSPPFSP